MVRLIVTAKDRATEIAIIVSHTKLRCPVAGCYAKQSWSPSR